MLFWLRQVCVLLVLGLTVYLFPALTATPQMLWDFYAELLRNEAVRRDWGVERAGEAALPARVRALIALLRDHRVESFRYSEGISRGSDEVAQRLAEGAYPIRLDPNAQHRLLAPDGPLAARCRVVASTPEAVLAYCP